MSKSNISDNFDNLINNLNRSNGKVIGQELQSSSMRLSPNDKGAMVNDVVDKYMQKKLDDSYVEKMKEEYGIEASDIAGEIAKREIQKILGQ